MTDEEKIENTIKESDLISRDLSWINFNKRVLDLTKNPHRNVMERLKFLAITASNLDEFFMIRIGSLYNYLDYDKDRTDYSGLDEHDFKNKLFEEIRAFSVSQTEIYSQKLAPLFRENNFRIEKNLKKLSIKEQEDIKSYYKLTIFPMLTPMVFDSYHAFPVLMNKVFIFAVVSKNPENDNSSTKLSLIQIPKNLPRFYSIERKGEVIFIPIEEIIRDNLHKLFRNINIISSTLFQITRNGDFTLEESDDIDTNFLDELRRKLKTRKTGRVVRVETEENPDDNVIDFLKERWEIDESNIFITKKDDLMDYTRFWEIINYPKFRSLHLKSPKPVKPLSFPTKYNDDIFATLGERDILLHHPYNSFDTLINLLEKAAEDPKVLSIKITIYRLAKNSRISRALLKAVESGKHVSVLFEVKARFDEENNLEEAKKLQNAGCFVIYGISHFKTHTKLLYIVRKEDKKITGYVHMSSGNYNEATSKLYTDISLLTSNEVYCNDVAEFFNVITGHSSPRKYKNLITAPKDMRKQIIHLIKNEAENAKKKLSSGIVIKINSLQDSDVIHELYKASQAGVKIKLIVRGICCLRPERTNLSENISVCSIVGDYLEHSRIYYFHNNNEPRIYSGSADVMVRSFDRRLESLFEVLDPYNKKEIINILDYNLRDNVNSYILHEDGSFTPKKINAGEKAFNIHKEFYNVKSKNINQVKLF